MAPDTIIRLDRVSKTFQGSPTAAVSGLSLDVAAGEIVVLVGPSGCGKTTTLKMINRLVEPSSGIIEVQGRDTATAELHELRRSIGYVIQQVGLFPHRTIAENIATVPRMLGWDRSRMENRIDELIDLVDLDRDLRNRYPSELSGGQRQRVGVARALAADPPILLMDEPFGAVDPLVRTRLQDEMLDLQRRLAKTIVLVTHDIDEAIRLGDRVAILDVGGRLAQYDTPDEILRRPAGRFVEDFLGRDRTLRRLALRTITADDLDPGPVVGPGEPLDTARPAMSRLGVDWCAVVDGDRLLGWARAADGAVPAVSALHSFDVELTPGMTLRDALDAIVTGGERMAPVVDGGIYRGMMTLDAISEALSR